MTARSLLARPIVLAALALLVANDHWAKAAYPGVVTGKLSDFAGLVFFPLLVVATIELVLGRPWRSRIAIVSVTAACLGAFAAINLWPAAGTLYASMLGHVQWIPLAAWAVVTNAAIPTSTPVAHAVDATDLLAAIPGAAVAVLIGLRGAGLRVQSSQ
jgi:hypothetical protein